MKIIIKKKKPTPSYVLDTYWTFATNRQNIFFKRLLNEPQWTNDEILTKYKFTNVYRASDRVSQYLIRNVIYNGDNDPKEVIFRILLFKIFNKISTWEILLECLGDISYKEYSFKQYNNVLSQAINSRLKIYSGAYIMASGKTQYGYEKKYQNHLMLIDFMIKDALPEKLQNALSLEEVYNILKSYPTIGSFLGYQYAIDINYSELINFDEMDFVIPGPGARDGIRKCFKDYGGYTEADIIRLMTDCQWDEFRRLDLKFKDLWGRPLHLIDCQNLFCEIDKYSRIFHPEINGISKRTRIKQLFNPNVESINYWYPPKWNINQKIQNEQI